VDVGFWEMLMLAVLALLIFGPERLPSIARSVGQTIGRIRREASSTFAALSEEAELSELREFGDDLRQERDQLRDLARLESKSKPTRPKRTSPPRFDPHAT
jgi:sec-independent protein translocase protein TatB